ncbi:site-specific integrase [Haloferax sp. AS1]|uniref:tyrosine-type recombinase/integrase n=1 Tax=Haloferax sp. AS1 TaxID=2562277 RepID=UPI00165F0F77|nr:site-specific integrase [Haloferax sp. AS1]
MYLESRKGNVRESTIQSHTYRLRRWLEFCSEQGIESAEDIEQKHFDQFKVGRRDEDELSPATLKGQMDTLRVYIQYLERVGAVKNGLSESVPSISLKLEDSRNERIVTDDEAHRILETLDRYHYATKLHAFFILGWRSSARISSLRALDLEDFSPGEQYVYFRERDSTELKNGVLGERPVALSEETTEVLSDYIKHHRIDNTDQFGREPFFSSNQGRVHRNTFRRWSYKLTCPAFRSLDTECDGYHKNRKCDDAVSPHGIRRGSITYFLRNGLPEKVVSDRANVSEKVLDKHYDKRSQMEKMEQRRDYLNNI